MPLLFNNQLYYTYLTHMKIVSRARAEKAEKAEKMVSNRKQLARNNWINTYTRNICNNQHIPDAAGEMKCIWRNGNYTQTHFIYLLELRKFVWNVGRKKRLPSPFISYLFWKIEYCVSFCCWSSARVRFCVATRQIWLLTNWWQQM